MVVPGFGSDLIFRAISGRFDTDNPTSVRIKERSNMLFSGDGYTEPLRLSGLSRQFMAFLKC